MHSFGPPFLGRTGRFGGPFCFRSIRSGLFRLANKIAHEYGEIIVLRFGPTLHCANQVIDGLRGCHTGTRFQFRGQRLISKQLSGYIARFQQAVGVKQQSIADCSGSDLFS